MAETETAVHHPLPSLLPDLLAEHARTRPEAPALTLGGLTRTFGELAERSARVTAALVAAGVRPGDRVGVLDRSHPVFFELLFGCAGAGAVLVGLNWRLAAPEVAEILRDADVRLLLVGPEQRDLVPDDPDLRLVGTDEEYEAWLRAAPPSGDRRAVAPEDAVLQLYSSGTTGRPKGAVLTQANLAWTGRMAGTSWRMDAGSVNLVPSPLFHIGGAGYGLTALSQGGHTVLVRDADPAGLLRAIEEHGVTHAFLVPAVVQSLLDAPEAASADLSTLQLVGYGAAPMTGSLLRRAIARLDCAFLGVYGMTETSGTVCVLPPEDHDPGGPRAHLLRSVGRPLPWVELSVRDPLDGAALGPGEVGEIWVRSGQTTAGYWGQPETTAAALTADGWLRTGDGAHLDADGYLFLHDRLKDMIITGGENVYPAEVENVLSDHPAVADVAVIAVPHARWGETVKAVVVPRPGSAVGVEELRAFARTRLAGYKCPTSVEVVEALPRNASGKVLKKDLRAQYAPGGAPAGAAG